MLEPLPQTRSESEIMEGYDTGALLPFETRKDHEEGVHDVPGHRMLSPKPKALRFGGQRDGNLRLGGMAIEIQSTAVSIIE